MKLAMLLNTKTVGLAATVGLLGGLSAIERPGTGASDVLPAETKQVTESEVKQAPQKAAWLGVLTEAINEDLAWHLKLDSGVIVRVVDPNSPAAEAGLQERDIITKVGDLAVQTREQVKVAITAHEPGDEILIKVLRQGVELDQRVVLGGRPNMPMAPQAGILRERIPGMDQLVPGGMDRDDAERLQAELLKRVEEALKPGRLGMGSQMNLNLNDLLNGAVPDSRSFNLGIQNTGAFSLTDDQGTVEMRTTDGKSQVKLTDPNGTVLFEGPYTTEEEKAAVPEEYRERIESLGFKGKGATRFQFNLGGGAAKKKD
ncbi:MAG: S1C family serine protease [Verrucomicrobiaceae bacterium]